MWEINADKKVMEFFPGIVSKDEKLNLLKRCKGNS